MTEKKFQKTVSISGKIRVFENREYPKVEGLPAPHLPEGALYFLAWCGDGYARIGVNALKDSGAIEIS